MMVGSNIHQTGAQDVNVVSQVIHQQNGGNVNQVSVPLGAANATQLVGSSQTRSMLRIQVASTSLSAVEIFFGASGTWGNGFELAIGSVLDLDGYIGSVVAVCDPNGGGSADVRVITAVAQGA